MSTSPNTDSTRPPNDRGRLTTTMRAARAERGVAREWVVRLAIVRRGQCLDERTFAMGSRITIGPTERDTFVVPELAQSWALLDWRGPSGVLRVPPTATGVHRRSGGGSSGEVAPSDRDLGEARGSEIELMHGDRGRVRLEGLSILFSVEPERHVAAARAAWSPPSRRTEFDAGTTSMAAASFLLHFGLLGAIYSDWADPPADDDLTITKLVDSMREPMTPPAVEVPQDSSDAQGSVIATKPSPAPTSERAPTHGEGPSRGAPRAAAKGPKQLDPDDLARELATMDVAMAGVLSSSGSSTDRVLRDSTVPVGMLTEADRNRGIGRRIGDLDMGGPIAELPRGSREGSLVGLGDRHVGESLPTAGTSRPTEGPKSPGILGLQPTGPADYPEGPSVIGRLAAGFRRCYQRGLTDENPDMSGSVRMAIKLGSNGDVVSVTATPSGSVSATVASCMAAKVQGATFPPPPSGGASLFVPVSVKPQK